MQPTSKPPLPAAIAACWIAALAVVAAAFVMTGPDHDRLPPTPASGAVASR